MVSQAYSSTSASLRRFSAVLFWCLMGVLSSETVNADVNYVFHNATTSTVTLRFTYCSGIIPTDGIVQMDLIAGAQWSYFLTNNVPPSNCVWVDPTGAVIKNVNTRFKMGTGSDANRPDTYELVNRPPALLNSEVIVRPRESVSVAARFDASWPHEIRVYRNGQEVRLFSNRSANSEWKDTNSTNSVWVIKITHRFEREYCHVHFIACLETRMEWKEGKSRVLRNDPRHLLIGYDDFPSCPMPNCEGVGDNDFNDAIVEVKIQ